MLFIRQTVLCTFSQGIILWLLCASTPRVLGVPCWISPVKVTWILPWHQYCVQDCAPTLFGGSAGFVYKHLKAEPKIVKKIFVYSSIAGGTGLLLGSCYGYYCKRGIFLSSIKGTATLFLVTSTFLGIKEAITLSEIVRNEMGSSKKLRFSETFVSGSLTGFLVGSAWWKNPINFFATAAVFGAVAASGQFVVDSLERWRIHRAVLLKYPELMELEWEAMEKSEQEFIRKKQQGWTAWALERLQDRPYIGKLKIKRQALYEELNKLDEEEKTLKAKFGLEEEVENEESSTAYDDIGLHVEAGNEQSSINSDDVR